MDPAKSLNCPNCLSAIEVGDVPPTVCPSCKTKINNLTGSISVTASDSYPGMMVIVLKFSAWVFCIAGIVAAIIIYPADPVAHGMTVESYSLAKALAPAQTTLAWQVAISGIVAGVFTGGFACILQTLEQIRDRMKV